MFSMAAATSAPPTGLDNEGAELPPSVDSASPGGDERGVANSSSNQRKHFTRKILVREPQIYYREIQTFYQF